MLACLEPVVELDGLRVKLAGRLILQGLTGSWTGRAIGLLGPNGAGKSTLINTLLGFYPFTGRARLNGFDVATQIRNVRGVVGYMPENDAFISSMSAVGFVRYMAELSGLPKQAALERAHETLFLVGLGEARYRKLGQYSLGMRQMAKLAQAIVHGPSLVILDEPTNGLDPPGRRRMIQLINEIRAAGQTRIILCSHLLRDVEETCEEVVILKSGRIVHTSNLEQERGLNRRFLELETVGELDGFQSGASALGCEVTVTTANRMRIALGSGVDVRDIYELASARNLQLRRVSFRRDTLEDIFLRAMEGGS
jgi:ABC-2 type transport system ATP-binding protein